MGIHLADSMVPCSFSKLWRETKQQRPNTKQGVSAEKAVGVGRDGRGYGGRAVNGNGKNIFKKCFLKLCLRKAHSLPKERESQVKSNFVLKQTKARCLGIQKLLSF